MAIWWFAVGVGALTKLLQPPPSRVNETGNWQNPERLTAADFRVATLDDDPDSAAVVRALGKPDSIVRSEIMGGEADLADWYYRDAFVTFTNGSFFGIRLRSPRLATKRGLRVGDPVRRVRQLYGVPSDTTDGEWMYPDPSRHDFLHTISILTERGTVRSIYLGWTID